MNGLGRQLEGSEGAGESVERVLDAIEFQTALLTLNAAVEAAHAAEPGTGSTALAGRIQNAAEHIAGRAAEGGQEVMAAPWQSDAFPPIAGPSGSTPQTAGNSGASAADSGVQARLWQESLERLRQSIGAASGAAPPIDTDGRPQAENALGVAPDPAPRRRRRSQPTQSSPRAPLDHGV
jgi:hypothetical protein